MIKHIERISELTVNFNGVVFCDVTPCSVLDRH